MFWSQKTKTSKSWDFTDTCQPKTIFGAVMGDDHFFPPNQFSFTQGMTGDFWWKFGEDRSWFAFVVQFWPVSPHANVDARTRKWCIKRGRKGGKLYPYMKLISNMWNSMGRSKKKVWWRNNQKPWRESQDSHKCLQNPKTLPKVLGFCIQSIGFWWFAEGLGEFSRSRWVSATRNSTGSMKNKVGWGKNEKPWQEHQDFRNPPKSWDFADGREGRKKVEVGSQPNFCPSIAGEKRGSFPSLPHVHLSLLTHRSSGGFPPLSKFQLLQLSWERFFRVQTKSTVQAGPARTTLHYMIRGWKLLPHSH